MPNPNHLISETSPYLLQHAYNPVEWHAWRPDAFEKAQKHNKPILVSIGYSTCHWCHVMEKESFEDEKIAAFMNKHFINIKVDREERPDVDQIYMEACQAISGSGGWPLNCFLTPDAKPFYAGTYFPPSPAHNRPSWKQVLQNLTTAFQHNRDKVEEQASRLMDYISKSDSGMLSDELVNVASDEWLVDKTAAQIYTALESRFDKREGGFGSAPKFPGSMALHFLLDYNYFTGVESALEQVQLSLDKMIMGGIYDQLGGGFARYATDKEWLVPHFEKMLYDNALLVSLLAEVYKATGKELYKDTINETLSFVLKELTSENGGFYTALDADSEGVEGKYYVWDKQEIEKILDDDAKVFNSFYGVSDSGNWENSNILWRAKEASAFSLEHQLEPKSFATLIERSKSKLLKQRATRIRPGLDDKILLGWNALQCTAFADAFLALGEEVYRDTALRNLDFLFKNFKQGNGLALFHTYKNGEAQYDAFLDDYAYLIEAMIHAYSITFETSWLTKAIAYSDFVMTHFYDEEEGLFFYTVEDQEDIIIRKKELFDNALPSGNSTMLLCLHQLSILTDTAAYRNTVTKMIARILHSIERYPSSFGRWARVVLYQIYPGHEIAVVGENYKEKATKIQKTYLPNNTLMAAPLPDDQFPLLKDKQLTKDAYIYVCRDYACQRPVKNLSDFRQLTGKP